MSETKRRDPRVDLKPGDKIDAARIHSQREQIEGLLAQLAAQSAEIERMKKVRHYTQGLPGTYVRCCSVYYAVVRGDEECPMCALQDKSERLEAEIERLTKANRLLGGALQDEILDIAAEESVMILKAMYAKVHADKQRLEAESAAMLARLQAAESNAKCPCCRASVNIQGEQCSECKGTGLVTIAYETVRVHEKLLRDHLAEQERDMRTLAEELAAVFGLLPNAKRVFNFETVQAALALSSVQRLMKGE